MCLEDEPVCFQKGWFRSWVFWVAWPPPETEPETRLQAVYSEGIPRKQGGREQGGRKAIPGVLVSGLLLWGPRVQLQGRLWGLWGAGLRGVPPMKGRSWGLPPLVPPAASRELTLASLACPMQGQAPCRQKASGSIAGT